MSAGKISLQASDGKVLRLIAPDGMPENLEGIVATEEYVDTVNTWAANDTRAKTAINATGDAPIYACRAWVNFNGTGTVGIRESGNVSSITDTGTGMYTVNFATAMPDLNYDFVTGHSSGLNAEYRRNTGVFSYDLTSIEIQCGYDDSTTSRYEDFDTVTVSVFR